MRKQLGRKTVDLAAVGVGWGEYNLEEIGITIRRTFGTEEGSSILYT